MSGKLMCNMWTLRPYVALAYQSAFITDEWLHGSQTEFAFDGKISQNTSQSRQSAQEDVCSLTLSHSTGYRGCRRSLSPRVGSGLGWQVPPHRAEYVGSGGSHVLSMHRLGSKFFPRVTS